MAKPSPTPAYCRSGVSSALPVAVAAAVANNVVVTTPQPALENIGSRAGGAKPGRMPECAGNPARDAPVSGSGAAAMALVVRTVRSGESRYDGSGVCYTRSDQGHRAPSGRGIAWFTMEEKLELEPPTASAHDPRHNPDLDEAFGGM